MRVFFTSDLHLGHANIAAYTGRPWLKDGDLEGGAYPGEGKPRWISSERAVQRAKEMSFALIKEINMRCTEEDTLVHVGDFSCYGSAYGVDGLREKGKSWESLIRPSVVHVVGNHDRNNRVKAMFRATVMHFGQMVPWVQHVPPWNPKALKAPPECDCYICGHVHGEWKTAWFEGKPVLNVGVDVHKYRPVRMDEVVGMINQFVEK